MLNGKFIGVVQKSNTFVVEKEFIARAGNAKLKIAALGLYFAEINGKRVGDFYLTPGWTSYRHTLQVQEYDVTALIRDGKNIISLTVNTGWYRGRLSWCEERENYGAQSAVCADLIMNDGLLTTDESWNARESCIRSSGIYDGEIRDDTIPLKLLDICEVGFNKRALTAQSCEPVRNIERIAVKEVIRTTNGELVYDFGQNLSGVAEIKTPENFNGTLTLQFAEILADGNFYTENLRSAKATDSFTVQGAKTLCPEFTYHGFRYMKLTGAELPPENITAIVRHTDMMRTGWIQTDHDGFNRLYENVIWGQKSNFVDIPTDCPQRDERFGWTGDINAFCTTAAYNYDVRGILKKWLRDLRSEQAETGEIPQICPNLFEKKTFCTAALWSDSIVMIPWKLYRMYGDRTFLTDNFPAMQKYLSAYEKNVENGLVVRGFNYGDWLALDGEASQENMHGRTDIVFLASAFYAECLRIAAEIATLLGNRAAEEYRNKYEMNLQAIRSEYVAPSGRIACDTMTAQTLALVFHLVPKECVPHLAKLLNDNVIAHGYRVVTGFIGTPYLLFALSDNGYHDTACGVLMNENFPGWLYEVKMGATTVWERWNGLLPGGVPNPDGMNSYNHYAYGSVMEFVYRRIAGIQETEAGFRKVKIIPALCRGISRLRAEFNSVHGKIVSGYEFTGDKAKYFLELPKDVEGEWILPKKGSVTVRSGFNIVIEDVGGDCGIAES